MTLLVLFPSAVSKVRIPGEAKNNLPTESDRYTAHFAESLN
jgi:hypothetical protein